MTQPETQTDRTGPGGLRQFCASRFSDILPLGLLFQLSEQRARQAVQGFRST